MLLGGGGGRPELGTELASWPDEEEGIMDVLATVVLAPGGAGYVDPGTKG